MFGEVQRSLVEFYEVWYRFLQFCLGWSVYIALSDYGMP
jgi:hypothetical protein